MFMLIVQNTAPWTYLGNLPVNPLPDASFDDGLDALGLTRLRTLSTLRHARQFVQPSATVERQGRLPAARRATGWRSWAERPTALQLDGEAVGERVSVRFRSHPQRTLRGRLTAAGARRRSARESSQPVTQSTAVRMTSAAKTLVRPTRVCEGGRRGEHDLQITRWTLRPTPRRASRETGRARLGNLYIVRSAVPAQP